MASVEEIVDLLARVRARGAGLVLRLEGRYTAVGDLHGDADTLERVLEEWPAPYLFLGDYVDRGDRGLEVVTQVFQLYVEGKAVVLRGNHESPLMNIDGGFLDELCEKLGRRCGYVYKEFEKTFASLPLAALLNGRVVALHGGIPLRDDMTPATLGELEKVTGDLTTPQDPLAFQVLWNDPCPCDRYAPSPRGPGIWLFGREATKAFHRAHNTATVVRGHTYVPQGCASHHGGAVVTVFTSTAGPYRKTRPKIALVDDVVQVYDLDAKKPAQCPEDVDVF
ncbi:serine/threonine protein phosphatase [Pyrobaculum sp. 3827-6]|uniref:metallophosphoesterase family protein n=1 Tax=Pyrobaculum sp. 3827-6 TaxID=2983604 RepID=UPI0021D85E5F|nr:metallophosphoesterase family protein [Pyrobaculum sp. 3827-6]MCU7788700.1 serine/threonine protein phosphatase [Pyrobaculum sp. 3827-6]